MPTTELDSTMSSGGTKPGKDIPPHHERKAEGLGDALVSLQGCMPNHTAAMSGGQPTGQHNAPPLKKVEGSATWYIPSVSLGPSP